MTPPEFHAAFLAYLAWSRGSQTSGWRSPERNALVNGHKNSKHMIGLASDAVYGPNPKPPLARARKAAAQLGLKLIREGSHDHLQSL